MTDIDGKRRDMLKKMKPEDAVAYYLETLPPERQALVFALWNVLADLTEGVTSARFTFDKDRVTALVEVMTDDLPELLQLAPEEQMPLEMKEMFRSWISGFEHMLPIQRVQSGDRKNQLMVATLLGAWL